MPRWPTKPQRPPITFGYVRYWQDAAHGAAQRSVIDKAAGPNVSFYEDRAVSAYAHPRTRPAFRELAGTLRKGDTLIITSTDVIAADLCDFAGFMEYLSGAGAALRIAPVTLEAGTAAHDCNFTHHLEATFTGRQYRRFIEMQEKGYRPEEIAIMVCLPPDAVADITANAARAEEYAQAAEDVAAKVAVWVAVIHDKIATLEELAAHLQARPKDASWMGNGMRRAYWEPEDVARVIRLILQDDERPEHRAALLAVFTDNSQRKRSATA